MTLKTDIDQLAADAVILHDIIHNPSGTVATEGGAVKAVAQAVADAEATIVIGANSYLDQCQAETALATAQADTATNQAAYAAASALSAASVVEQDLSAIDQTVFAATLVDCILYDTAEDSDGGAWRKRCAHTSWENETLSGNWLGSAANETAARAITGATTGSYYYDTTALGFYTLDSGSGKTATYRGNVRQFPSKVLITVESARVVLWDLTQAGCPMWMNLPNSVALAFFYGGNGNTAVSMLNGVLAATQTTSLLQANFAADSMESRRSTGLTKSTKTIGDRNSAFAHSGVVAAGAIVNSNVNDVAMTVLSNAPVDLATGLPVPTIAVATDGGVSVINHDGTVADSQALVAMRSVAFKKNGRLLYAKSASSELFTAATYAADGFGQANGAATYKSNSIPAINGGAASTQKRPLVFAGHDVVIAEEYVGATNKVTRIRENIGSVAAGMAAYLTKDYNSGWLPGDIRGAWLADTTAETLVGSELVTNGDFASDSSANWLNVGNATNITAAAGALRFESTGGSSIVVRSSSNNNVIANLVVGKVYTLSAKLTQTVGGGGETYQLRVYNSSASTILGLAEITTTTGVAQTVSVTFTATENNFVLLYPWVTTPTAVADAFELDDLSVRLAVPDRSVKAKGLQVFGSVTKAAVASGAQLMAYSGFSVANYLEQPYNSDLDFGAGDFHYLFWMTPGTAATNRGLIARGNTGNVAGSFEIDISAGNAPLMQYNNGASWASVFTASTTYSDTLPHLCCIRRTGSTLTMLIDAVQVATTSFASTLTNATGVLRAGLALSSSVAHSGVVALLRAGATYISDEQIKHIYETEKGLFEAGAQCCLAGTSNAVTALAYDDETDLLHVGTSYGRSTFKGLKRVASEATAVGAITALAAGSGIVAQAGATAVDVYVPAYSLREELNRDAEQMARFGQNLIAHDFTAAASQTTFTLPVGWEIVAVYQQGSIKRETTSWTRSFDGFKWSAVLGTGATVSDWISILAKRV